MEEILIPIGLKQILLQGKLYAGLAIKSLQEKDGKQMVDIEKYGNAKKGIKPKAYKAVPIGMWMKKF